MSTPDTPLVALGKAIVKWRRSKDLTQPALAAACGYPYNIVSKWENAQNKPTRADYDRLVELLGPEFKKESTPYLEEAIAHRKTKGLGGGSVRIDKGINHRLQLLREDHGYTQAYVAEVIGRPSSQISRIESHQANPTLNQVRQLAKLYGTSYEYILDGVRPPTESMEQVVAQRDRLRQILRLAIGADQLTEAEFESLPK